MQALGWDAWFTGGVLVLMLALLVRGRYAPDVVLMGALLTLLVPGVLEPAGALRGFSNPGVITVAMLYVVATAMRETGAMNLISERMLGRPKTVLEAQARLALPVAGMSAFINNTPIVAIFLPVLSGVAKKSGLPAGKLYIPLSYSSILGGICTLIGTSTTVVVAGMLISYDARGPEGEPLRFGMFTLTAVGLPIAVCGIAYILLFGRALLPNTGGPTVNGPSNLRRYTTALRVGEGSPVIGKSVEQAGLRNLPGLFLSRIEREENTIIAVGPQEVILGGDVLVFVGVLDSVVDLQKIKGLEPVADEGPTPDGYRPNMRLIEAVVASGSPLVGRTIREAGMRARYNAVVVAVHRQGSRVKGKLGDVRLQPGDTLLLEAPNRFAERYRDSTDFFLVSELESPAALRHDRAILALVILAGLIITITLGVFEPVVAAMAAAGLMVATRCCTGAQARASMDWQVLITIGAAFGIGHAMNETGLASAIAESLLAVAGDLGPWAILASVFLLTTVFTMMITNNAAAVLMFPIALSIAQAGDLNFMPFAVAIAVAASCEFASPIGYQTNLMVMGPGGYSWWDYIRFGGPLTVLCGVVCVMITPFVWGF